MITSTVYQVLKLTPVHSRRVVSCSVQPRACHRDCDFDTLSVVWSERAGQLAAGSVCHGFDPRHVNDNLSVPLWVYMRFPVTKHQIKPRNMDIASARAQLKINTHRCSNWHLCVPDGLSHSRGAFNSAYHDCMQFNNPNSHRTVETLVMACSETGCNLFQTNLSSLLFGKLHGLVYELRSNFIASMKPAFAYSLRNDSENPTTMWSHV